MLAESFTRDGIEERLKAALAQLLKVTFTFSNTM